MCPDEYCGHVNVLISLATKRDSMHWVAVGEFEEACCQEVTRESKCTYLSAGFA